MARTSIERLIIKSPYEELQRPWRYDRERRLFDLGDGRRPAGCVLASPDIPGPSTIRASSSKSRSSPRSACASRPGTRRVIRAFPFPASPSACWSTGVIERDRRFFFCQLEAAETLIWFTEEPAPEREGIEIPRDGGEFVRQCCKMATRSGKTDVMTMVIAWDILNKVANPQDTRFSKNVLVVAPGLTVKKRLEVLYP